MSVNGAHDGTYTEETRKDTISTKYSPIAQLVEHLTVNQGVSGSSPDGRAYMCVKLSERVEIYLKVSMIHDMTNN